jgi:hypothetical protein
LSKTTKLVSETPKKRVINPFGRPKQRVFR